MRGVYPSSIKAAALVLTLSWCGDSIQVTSNAFWDRSHGTHPPGTDAPPAMHTPPATHALPPSCTETVKGGRYASYWNAFLFIYSFTCSDLCFYILLMKRNVTSEIQTDEKSGQTLLAISTKCNPGDQSK